MGMTGGISVLSTLKNKTIIYSWRHRPLKTYLFWTFFFVFVVQLKMDFLSLLSLMIHIRVSDVGLLCRASCCLKESNFLDKYCHYAVIYPFAIRACSLISSFMICLPKSLHCVMHVLENEIKYPRSHSASLFHTLRSSLDKSLPHIVPELLDKTLIKKTWKTWVFVCFAFLSFLSEVHSANLQFHLTQSTAWWHGK